jgi:hypothetical protein
MAKISVKVQKESLWFRKVNTDDKEQGFEFGSFHRNSLWPHTPSKALCLGSFCFLHSQLICLTLSSHLLHLSWVDIFAQEEHQRFYKNNNIAL